MSHAWMKISCHMTWFVHTCGNDSLICVTYIIRTCDVTHSSVSFAEYRLFYRALLQKRPVIIDMCGMHHSPSHDMIRSYVWQWLIDVTYQWVIDMTSMRHASFVRVTWLNSIIGCTCVTWLISTCEMTFIVCDMTHSHVWHASFVRVTWLIHMCYTTHSYVWHDSFICVTWPIHTCVSTL